MFEDLDINTDCLDALDILEHVEIILVCYINTRCRAIQITEDYHFHNYV